MPATAPSIERFGLVESLNRPWFKLPFAVMRSAGPASQTLAGLLKITNRETFTATSNIAENARLPLATVRKHLVTLHDQGWIQNDGRCHTRRGAPRRTCTIKITNQTRNSLNDYGVLPWWAVCETRGREKLTWSSKATLSVVMGRLMSLKGAAERDDRFADDESEAADDIENLGYADLRFRFSLDRLHEMTGLSRDSVVTAKRELARLGIIRWMNGYDPKGGTPPQHLEPNYLFRIVITPAGNQRIFLEFDGGSKNG